MVKQKQILNFQWLFFTSDTLLDSLKCVLTQGTRVGKLVWILMLPPCSQHLPNNNTLYPPSLYGIPVHQT